MTLQFTPIIIFYALAAIITLFLAYRTWKMRPANGVSFWAGTMLFSSIYALGTGLEVLVATPELKYAMIPIIYLGVTGIMFFWGLFCISYSQYQKWLTKNTMALLLVLPLTTFILTLFLDKHNLMYQTYEFINQDGLLLSHVVTYGTFFWIWVAYSYATLIIGAAILIQSAIRFPNLFQGQASMVILSVLIPAIASVMYVFGINPLDPFDTTPVSLTISGVIMLFAVKRYRFLEITPIAHDLVFNNVEIAVIIIDIEGRIINMNSAAETIFQRFRNQVIGAHAYDAFPEHRELQERFRNVLDIKTEISINDTSYELKITPLNNRRQQLAGRIIMLYNITERIQMEGQQLELAVERERVQILQQFISDVSHDLKTPLTTMKATHYLLRRQFGDAASERIDKLEYQTERLIKLVDDMLTMVRLDEATEHITQIIDVNSLIRHTISKHPTPNGPRLQFKPSPDKIITSANQTELSQVVSNLLTNAIHNTAADGEIHVSTYQDEESVQIEVKDTGVGISEADLPKIFDRFYRVDKARNTSNGFSGLGLSIAKRIIERHNGRIEVSSTVNKGSDFRLILPLVRPQLSQAMPQKI